MKNFIKKLIPYSIKKEFYFEERKRIGNRLMDNSHWFNYKPDVANTLYFIGLDLQKYATYDISMVRDHVHNLKGENVQIINKK